MKFKVFLSRVFQVPFRQKPLFYSLLRLTLYRGGIAGQDFSRPTGDARDL